MAVGQQEAKSHTWDQPGSGFFGKLLLNYEIYLNSILKLLKFA